MKDAYRDPLAALRGAVEEKRAAIDARARALSPVRRAVLSPDAVAAIEALETVTSSFGDAELRAIDARLDELAERLDRAKAASDALLADVGSPEQPEIPARASATRFERDGVPLFLLTSRSDASPPMTLALAVGMPRSLPRCTIDAQGRTGGDLSLARHFLLPAEAGLAVAIAEGRATIAWTDADLARLPQAIELALRIRRRVA